MIFEILVPNVEVITPIRDLKLSREAEIEYLQKHGVEVNAEKAKYSINKGLWGTSVGGKERLTSKQYLPDESWPTPITKTGTDHVTIVFVKGAPVTLNGEAISAVEVIQK